MMIKPDIRPGHILAFALGTDASHLARHPDDWLGWALLVLALICAVVWSLRKGVVGHPEDQMSMALGLGSDPRDPSHQARVPTELDLRRAAKAAQMRIDGVPVRPYSDEDGLVMYTGDGDGPLRWTDEGGWVEQR